MFCPDLRSGCAQLGAIFRGITVEDHIKIVQEAVKQGINYLDCAPFFNFGRAEEVLGQVSLCICVIVYVRVCVMKNEHIHQKKYRYAERKTNKAGYPT